MTNIVEEVQLDYCDVMIKPKRSTLNSRNEPDIYRDYKFKWTNDIIRGNGLTVANMATTGTFAMTSDIPSAVTESTVSDWGFTKNAGTVVGSGLTADKLVLGNGTTNIANDTHLITKAIS